MILVATILSIVSAVPAAQLTDTTLTLRRATVLDVTNARGSVSVSEWSRPEVRIRAFHGSAERIRMSEGDDALVVVAESHAEASVFLATGDTSRVVIRQVPSRRVRHPGAVDYDITVPAGFRVRISGDSVAVVLDHTSGAMAVSALRGRIHALRTKGPLHFEMADGAIAVDSGSGNAFARALRGSVIISEFAGTAEVHGVSASVTVSGRNAAVVRASTVGGSISVLGPLARGSRYTLDTHRGAIGVIASGARGATIDVASPRHPVVCATTREAAAPSASWRRFIAGEGAARVEIDSFDGEVRLCDR